MPSVTDLGGTDLLAPGLTVLVVTFCLAVRRFVLPASAALLLQARLDELSQDLDVAWLRGRVRPDRREVWQDAVRRARRDPRRELETDPPALFPEDMPKRYAERLRRCLDAYARAALPRASRRPARRALAATVGPPRGQRTAGTPGPVARRARTAVVVTALSVVAVAVTGAFAVSTDWLHEAYARRGADGVTLAADVPTSAPPSAGVGPWTTADPAGSATPTTPTTAAASTLAVSGPDDATSTATSTAAATNTTKAAVAKASAKPAVTKATAKKKASKKSKPSTKKKPVTRRTAPPAAPSVAAVHRRTPRYL